MQIKNQGTSVTFWAFDKYFLNLFYSSQLQREREEMERRDLQRMILDGEKKQKDAKKKQVGYFL